MYLEHLTINGFKSFAKKSELEFSAPITAIVGPNGSGKSNVAESFRFVLGEQSFKSMRSKKGEDLIFGGSEAVSRGNRAAVTISLNNTTRVFPLDYDSITIERTVHRDGQNEYVVNGSKVRLKDVHELLAAANIGATGHHIISQGEADRILSASARERREMIEDALGLKVFQYKKSDAEKKLEKTRENIEKVQSLRREVAPHILFLERQIKKIERAIALRSELTTVYAEYLKREDVYIAFHHDRLTAERQVPMNEEKELVEALKRAKEVLSTHTKDKKTDELLGLEQALAQVRNERQNLLRSSGQIEGQILYIERRIAEVEKQVSSKSDAPIPVGEIEKLVTQIEKMVDGSTGKQDVAYLRRTLVDIVHLGRKFLQTALGTVSVNTEREEKEKNELVKKQDDIQARIILCNKKEQDLTNQYSSLKQSIEAEESDSRDAEREMFAIMARQQDCQRQLDRIESELRVLERDREEFKRELQEAVTLLGREAALYYEYVVKEGETAVSEELIVTEPRSRQHDRRREMEKMKIRLEELGGVNQDIEKEYKEVKERDDFLVREITDLEASVIKLETLIVDLTQQIQEQFVSGIEKIGIEFSRFFTLMFGGGEAKLIRTKPKLKKKDVEDEVEFEEGLETEEEVVEEGIDLDVKLPNKRIRGLEMLSGGERALTSIALIFAMSQIHPPPFIILDETDAALDEANSRRYGDMIEALAKKSQLILITHNRETMSRAGILYGVTMGGDGVSKLLSVKFDDAVAVAKS